MAHSLRALQEAIHARGGSQWIIEGNFSARLEEVIRGSGVKRLYYSYRVGEPFASLQNAALEVCRAEQVELKPFFSEYWFEPGSVLNKQQSPYVVFTPFYKALMARIDQLAPLDDPLLDFTGRCLLPPHPSWRTLPDSLAEREKRAWACKVMAHWQPGEAAAWERLEQFIESQLADYDENRNIPVLEATSRLSAHLHFGEISRRSIYFYLQAKMEAGDISGQAAYPWIRQLAWHEFSRLLLWHFPQTQFTSFQAKFEQMSWEARCRAA